MADEEPLPANLFQRRLQERGFVEVSDPAIATRENVIALADTLNLKHRFEVSPRHLALETLEKIASLPQKLNPWCIMSINRVYDNNDANPNMGARLIEETVIVFCFTEENDAIYANLCRA